ncbi:mitochondrial substrate carrier family protein [Citrus sinensis]|uniref:Mitochondrial substrate carrier family protein n=1 Tax=Citrus sinensis TaxID=2711 RepID=A0ACB8KDY1_CITSI|nr:mitochondrial substrate carrier family protein [Citrus sinensis]
MATQNDSTFREGQSTTRPPYFDGNDYPYWKTRMRIYLQVLDYEIWEIVNDGSFMPLTKNEVGEDIPKPSREWNEFEKRKASLNSKAMNALFCALDKKEFHRVSSCESANEIWHKLEVVYEGTNQVKECKISRCTRQYELFQMEQNENVYSMYTRFTDIVNTLGALGKTFLNSEKVNKIIRSLPKEWRQKRTVIEEAKDLNVLPINDLIGSLISYEEDLAAEKGHEEKKKNISLKASKCESDGESEMDDEELAMLARRFRKFYKKNNEQRKFRGYKNKKEKNESITCYECKKPGYIRPKCPLFNKLKKKAMVATWDDSDEETSDDDEQQEMTNLDLMAIGEESCDELDETETVNTACYVLNRVLIRPNLNKTPYELWKDRKPNIGYFKVFGCKCFVLITKDNLGKFDPKSDVGIFLGYSNSIKTYRVYNKRTLVVEKSMHVTFDESNPSSTEKVVVDDNAEEELQEEASNDNQEDAPHEIQEEHHEETNVEQNEDAVSTHYLVNAIQFFADSTNGDGDDVPVEKLENRVEDNHEEMNMYEGDGETSESKNMVNQNQEENLVKESFDENTESEEESKAVSKNYNVRKREDKESKSEGGDSNSEAGETEGGELNKIEQIESENSLDENKWMRLIRLKRRRILKIKIMTLRAVERIRLQLRFFLLVTSQKF